MTETAPQVGGVPIDTVAVKIAAALGDRIVYRRGKFRFRVHRGLGRPVSDAVMVAVVGTHLPPMPVVQSELLARVIVASDTFKEGLG